MNFCFALNISTDGNTKDCSNALNEVSSLLEGIKVDLNGEDLGKKEVNQESVVGELEDRYLLVFNWKITSDSTSVII